MPHRTTTEYLDVLGFEKTDRISVNHEPVGGNFTSRIVTVANAPALVEQWADHSCWLGANPISADITTGRGGADDVVAIRTLYADLDLADDKLPTWDAIDAVIADLSEMLETPPAAVVMSGHGKQPRWTIEEDGDFDRERAALISRRFGKAVQQIARVRGGTCDSVHDLSRVLRAPGTLNTKDPANPVEATVTYPGGYALDLDHVEKVLDAWNMPEVEQALTVTPVRTDPTMMSALQRYVAGAVTSAVDLVANTTSGRNNALNEQVFSIASIAAHDPELVDRQALYGEMARACQHNGYLDDEGNRSFHNTFESAWTAGLLSPRRNWPPAIATPDEPAEPGRRWLRRSWDDFGNADRLVDHHPGKLLWVQQAENWAVWDGQRWAMDTTASAQRLAQETITALPDTEAHEYDDTPTPPKSAGGNPGPSEREAFNKWVRSQRKIGKVRDMIATTRGLPGLSVGIADFDTDPMLLNCANGILDLHTLDLLPHEAKYRQMQQIPVRYNPDAKAPLWEAFLEKMHPDAEVREYLQRAIGYSLTGSISEQKMFMHLGEGANGKSVFLEVMTGMFGSYGQAIPRTTLLVKKYEGIPNDIARMAGKRFLQTSETGKGQQLDEEQVKSLTGGEEQAARFMRQEFFDFKPTGKIHYVTNHFPRVSDARSLWRRLVVLKWLTIIDDNDPTRDHLLGQKIVQAELEGVLAWAVRGLVQWQLVGLSEPEIVRRWAAEYKEDADDFGDYLADCTVANPNVKFTPVHKLYEAYTAWMDRGGRGAPMSIKAFSTAMKERSFATVRGRQDGTQSRGFAGIEAVPAWRSTTSGWAAPAETD